MIDPKQFDNLDNPKLIGLGRLAAALLDSDVVEQIGAMDAIDPTRHDEERIVTSVAKNTAMYLARGVLELLTEVGTLKAQNTKNAELTAELHKLRAPTCDECGGDALTEMVVTCKGCGTHGVTRMRVPS